jgi:glycosyltransferase involved in cell wall biosynthesis
MSLVSVVIPSYNSARFVAGAIDSALAQTYWPLEIVVVDDGSTDNTAEVLAPYGDRIRVLRQENRGLAGARNCGLRAAKGDLIALLDADDQWLPEKLEKQVALLGDPDVGLVHCAFWHWRPDTDERIRRDLIGRARYVGDCYERLFTANGVLPSTALFRRACLDRAGLFDERLRSVEDLDLWYRMARHFRFAYVDEPLALYRLHGDSLTQNKLRMWRSELIVTHKQLAADPEYRQRVGAALADQKLFDLCFNIGYLEFDAGNFTEARRHFAWALRRRPFRLRCASLLLASLLPGTVVRALRRAKQRVASSMSQTRERSG